MPTLKRCSPGLGEPIKHYEIISEFVLLIQIPYSFQLVPVTRIEFWRNGQGFGSWIEQKLQEESEDSVTRSHTRTLPAQPGRCRHSRDSASVCVTRSYTRTLLAQPERRCAGQDAVESAGTPSGWQGCSRVSRDAVGSAGTPSG